MKILSSATHLTDFAERCWASQRAYAERIGADYQFLMRSSRPNPADGHLDVVFHAPEDELVLILDWDVEVSEDAPDLRDLFTHGLMLPVFGSSATCGFTADQRRRVPGLTGPYFNTGLILGHAYDVNAIREGMTPAVHRMAEGSRHRAGRYEAALNLSIQQSGIPVTPLPDGLHVYPPNHGPFLHHAGPAKHNHPSLLHS